jgi:hypothetical protein
VKAALSSPTVWEAGPPREQQVLLRPGLCSMPQSPFLFAYGNRASRIHYRPRGTKNEFWVAEHLLKSNQFSLISEEALMQIGHNNESQDVGKCRLEPGLRKFFSEYRQISNQPSNTTTISGIFC